MLPALAVARELRVREHQVRFVGVERGMEAKLVPAENFPIEWIEIGGLNRVGFRQTLATLGELPFSVWQVRILDLTGPAAVFSGWLCCGTGASLRYGSTNRHHGAQRDSGLYSPAFARFGRARC